MELDNSKAKISLTWLRQTPAFAPGWTSHSWQRLLFLSSLPNQHHDHELHPNKYFRTGVAVSNLSLIDTPQTTAFLYSLHEYFQWKTHEKIRRRPGVYFRVHL